MNQLATGRLAQFTQEAHQHQRGGAIVLEGARGHRLQLAQALARQPLCRVNLGAVVSKYIGETEKNLDAIFARANHPGSILLFDEADALFGSRTDVKDAHDRYANLFDRLLSFQGRLVLGVDRRHSVPAHLLARCKIMSVYDYWPPR